LVIAGGERRVSAALCKRTHGSTVQGRCPGGALLLAGRGVAAAADAGQAGGC